VPVNAFICEERRASAQLWVVSTITVLSEVLLSLASAQQETDYWPSYERLTDDGGANSSVLDLKAFVEEVAGDRSLCSAPSFARQSCSFTGLAQVG